MTYTDAESYIHSFTRFGSQLGLGRIARLLDLMGNPQNKLKFLHIAGTNGKGSTVKMSATVLGEAGYRVGMYISPFVIDFRERFQVNGKMIEKAHFIRLVEKVIPFINLLESQGENVTEFEVVTAVAFEFFYEMSCDIVCLEVGLGGKYDATNVISPPLAAIITSISLDHTQILGDTIAQIAGEKAGIIKENTDTVTYPLQDVDALAAFMERCSETHSTLTVPNENSVTIKECSVLGSKFTYDSIDYSLRLVGKHQIYNAITVIEAMHILKTKGFMVTDEAIHEGLKKAKFPARFEIMAKHPLIIVDGAHNIQAAGSLAQSLDMIKKPIKVAVMGMMADKDVDLSVKLIAKSCSSIITLPVANSRTIDPVSLSQIASKYCDSVYPIEDYDEALQKAMELCGKDGVVVVCGSFYMASDMRKNIKAMLKSPIKNI